MWYSLLAPLFLVVLITGIVALVKNTPTWLRFRNRRAATIVTAVSAVAFLITGNISANVWGNGARDVSDDSPSATTATTPATDEDADDEDAVARFVGLASTSADATATTGLTALEVLASLPVREPASETGYSQEEFGERWLDIDRNGCDTRNDILGDQLADVVRRGACTVVSGKLHDPYTAKRHDFVRGQDTSEHVQIDHVVSLNDAWQKGAQNLTADQRATFANDPLNLLAVTDTAVRMKGDSDAASWLPSNRKFHCEYVARQVAVKATYGLWVTLDEQEAISAVLASCPTEPVHTSLFADRVPAATPTPTQLATSSPSATPSVVEPVPFAPPMPDPPAPAPEPEPEPPAPAYYKNCTEVRDAGAAPLYQGDPGYAKHLDRDGDGVACE